MNNQNNDAEKAIITLGKIFKIFAAIVVVLIIALCVYLASNSEPTESKESSVYSQSNSFFITHYAFLITH